MSERIGIQSASSCLLVLICLIPTKTGTGFDWTALLKL
jgi:hypothetical protein